jgi:cytochrome oxidase Cu insertion factor (SCO1/SenC/PrrC family)
VAIVLVGTAPMVAASVTSRSDIELAESADGAPVVVTSPAPPFQLVDQHGSPVSLADLRGHTVALTFLDPVCTTDCPIIAQEFRVANQLLGRAAGQVRFVSIAANPVYHSVPVLAAFDRQEGLASQSNWLFLTGTRSALQTVWNDYGVTAVDAPAGGMVAHSDVVYVIDAHGDTRRILNADPGAAGPANQSSFSSLLAEQITQVIGS